MTTPYPITARYMDYNLTVEAVDVSGNVIIIDRAKSYIVDRRGQRLLTRVVYRVRLNARHMDYNLTAEE